MKLYGIVFCSFVCCVLLAGKRFSAALRIISYLLCIVVEASVANRKLWDIEEAVRQLFMCCSLYFVFRSTQQLLLSSRLLVGKSVNGWLYQNVSLKAHQKSIHSLLFTAVLTTQIMYASSCYSSRGLMY